MLAIIRLISTCIFCFLLPVAAAKAAEDDWFTYRHDSARTGAQPIASDLSDPVRIAGLHVVAQFPPEGSPAIPGGFKASPIVVNGTAFIGDTNGFFYALDAASGALLWQYPKAGDRPLLGSCGAGGYGGYGTYGIATGATFAVIGGQNAVIFGAPDPSAQPFDPTGIGWGSARLFALPLSADPSNPQPIWKSDIVATVNCKPGSIRHERIAYSSPLVLGDKVYVGIHDTGDNPIQQGKVVAVDLNTGQIDQNFTFVGAGKPGDGSLGGGVWNALATDGSSVYFTTGNSRPAPWCVYPYYGTDPKGKENCPAATEPTPNNGLSMIKVNSATGVPDWIYQTVPFDLDGDPDWAAGATVMSTTCGELIASVQKDGWSYAIAASGPPPQPPPEPHPLCSPSPPPPVEEPGLNAPSWQFPPTTNGGWFTDCNQVHGDDDYRRPGAAWNDVFIVRTGGEANTDRSYRGYSELHALNACATSEQDRVRWIAEIPNMMSPDGHISYSSPTVTGGIVFIGTNQNKNDNKGHLVVLTDPSVAPASQQVCSNVNVPLAACTGSYAPVWSLQPLLDIPMPDGGSLASMRNEPVLAEGRVFVATNSPSDPPDPKIGHVYILAPGCSCDFVLNTSINQLYLGPNTCPIQVAQSGASQSLLVMTGPWVASDHGVNANGAVVDEVDKNSLPNGSTISLTPGFPDWGPGLVPQSDALMGISVSVPASAPVGQYCIDVKATDLATRVSAIAAVPIQIYNCTPLTACPAGACGIFPTGCGGNLQCGVCAAPQVCTGGGCCNPFVTGCGERCKAPLQFCFKTKSCVPQGRCPM
jgi:outer membrane protein assembly factor BamB